MVLILSLSSRYSRIENILESHFDDRINNVSYNIRGRLRVLFTNGAVLDVRYPTDTSYSFYLNYSSKTFRIDTAPHHEEIGTFPNHCHYEIDDNIIVDEWTSPDNSIEDNVMGLITWLEVIFLSFVK